MTRFGLVKDGVVVKEQNYSEPPEDVKVRDGKPMWRPIQTVTKEYDPLVKTHTVNRVIQNYKIVDTWIVEDLPAETVEANLLAELAAYRYQKEVGGITIGGMTILTDDRSKTLINGAWASATSNPQFTTKFKTTSGWAPLNASQVIAVAIAVGNYVNHCFEAEEAIEEEVKAGEYATTAEMKAAFDAKLSELME